MGVVHEAFDRRLDRPVAIKMIRDESGDPRAQERLLREARAAAALSHPNICLIHEIAQHDGQPFLVMEMLEGEPLSARIARGALPLLDALDILLPVLDALSALHELGIVHRDLKPSNIFMTPHGVKLLDFGLARPMARDTAFTAPQLTMPGTMSGTLRYMAPEQITGDPVDARTDVFAAGVLLYELVTGRPPFHASSTLDWLNAVLRHEPPPTGLPAMAPIEPVLNRALQRLPDNRYPSAQAMAADLQPLVQPSVPHTIVEESMVTASARIVVLPFRLLKADDDTAFLENALPEALTTSLSALPSLVVRSNLAALRFAEVDLTRIAVELDVDHVVTGTLLRCGEQVRVTAQLVETPGGRVKWSHRMQQPLGDLFALQDEVCREIVQSLPFDGTSAD